MTLSLCQAPSQFLRRAVDFARALMILEKLLANAFPLCRLRALIFFLMAFPYSSFAFVTTLTVNKMEISYFPLGRHQKNGRVWSRVPLFVFRGIFLCEFAILGLLETSVDLAPPLRPSVLA